MEADGWHTPRPALQGADLADCATNDESWKRAGWNLVVLAIVARDVFANPPQMV